MEWSEDRFKARTTERGKVWQQIADNLNSDHTLQFPRRNWGFFRETGIITGRTNASSNKRSLRYQSSKTSRFRICLCLENVLFGILTENSCPLLQLLNYFIIVGKLYLWDYRSKQILPNIYGFRANIIAKYETEGKISNKKFFKRKWMLTPYLS